MPTFSEKLRCLMRDHGETTRSLGAAVDVSSGAVTGWTAKGAAPRPDVTKRLAEHFGVSVQDLIDNTRELPGQTKETQSLSEDQPAYGLVANPIKTAAALARREHGDTPEGQSAFERHLANLRAMRDEAERLYPRNISTAARYMDALIASYITALDQRSK